MIPDNILQSVKWLVDNTPLNSTSYEDIYTYWLKIRPIKRSLRGYKNLSAVAPLFQGETSTETVPGTFFSMEEALFVFLGPNTEELRQKVVDAAAQLKTNLNALLDQK